MKKQLTLTLEEKYGPETKLLVDAYWAITREDNDAGRAFLEVNPTVKLYLQDQQQYQQNTALLAKYFESEQSIRSYYNGLVYDAAKELYGDVWEKFAVYGQLRDAGETKAARQYWKDHPELQAYREFRDEGFAQVDKYLLLFGQLIEKAEGLFYRDDEKIEIPEFEYDPTSREQRIANEVLAYSQGQMDDLGDALESLREVADARFPGTRALADRYYKLQPSDAAKYLNDHPKLQPRIEWEYGRLLRLEMMRNAQLEEAAAPEPQSFSGPIGRLMNDPEGLPEHLQELIYSGD